MKKHLLLVVVVFNYSLNSQNIEVYSDSFNSLQVVVHSKNDTLKGYIHRNLNSTTKIIKFVGIKQKKSFEKYKITTENDSLNKIEYFSIGNNFINITYKYDDNSTYLKKQYNTGLWYNYHCKFKRNLNTSEGWSDQEIEIDFYFPDKTNKLNSLILPPLIKQIQETVLQESNVQNINFFKEFKNIETFNTLPSEPSVDYGPFIHEVFKGTLFYQSNNFITYKIIYYTYDGGAHGDQYEIYYNYDVKNNKVITYNDIFKQNIENKIIELLQSKIATNVPIQNLFITNYGIGFVTYLHSNYRTEIILSYDELNNYIKDNIRVRFLNID